MVSGARAWAAGTEPGAGAVGGAASRDVEGFGLGMQIGILLSRSRSGGKEKTKWGLGAKPGGGFQRRDLLWRRIFPGKINGILKRAAEILRRGQSTEHRTGERATRRQEELLQMKKSN